MNGRLYQSHAGITRRHLLVGAAPAALGAPSPYGAVPSARQLLWHQMEVYSFLHFGINTFTDKEWGYGDEDPNLFCPEQFDADAIVAALKAGGMKGVILTCKHHDGFCLWPTRTTAHSIRHSKWRGGRGDVVRDISEAARRAGLKFGIYVSPWDRHDANYGRPEYVATYREQLRELLTQYGPLFEVWHDGANAGDGYYGGAREKRIIDNLTYYGWPKLWEMVRELQPDACIFSFAGPDIRWVGNENGIANETCWATHDAEARNKGPAGDLRGTGIRHGRHWMPAECDVSIRPGWFWHEKENGRVKTPRQLLDLYYKSVGRGASLLLNVPPDRRGLVHENDAAALAGFGKALEETFRENLAGAPRRARGGREYVVDLKRAARFNVVRLREEIRFGQRVDAFALDAWQSGGWRQFAAATSIGACRLIRTEQPVDTDRVRLRITQDAAEPLIAEFGLYREGAAG